MFDMNMSDTMPLLVFCARVVDVSLGTLRIIFVSRGRKYIAPLLGFIEVLIWVSVIAQIIKGEYNFITYIAFAGGFAMGNYVGIFIEDKLALGMLVIRIIIQKNAQNMISNLQENGYGFTVVDAYGSQGVVKLIYTVVKRKNLSSVAKIIQISHPNAFFTVEELKSTAHGVFPQSLTSQEWNFIFRRKSK